MITKDDVIKALSSLETHLDSDDIEKGEDLNTSNGAADESGDLKVEAENMNDKHGNKKSSKGATMDYEKSIPDDFSNGLPGEIETKVDVSNFLKSLVDHTADSHDSLRDFVVKSDMANEARYEEMEERFEEVQKSLANVGLVLKAMCERMGMIENQPAVSKSVSQDRAGGAVDRTFQKSDLDQENPLNQAEDDSKVLYKSLAGRPAHVVKSMISDKLCDLVRKGEAQDVDVINFETYNHISPELDEKLRHAFA